MVTTEDLDRMIREFSVHSREAMENKEELFRRMREKRCPMSSAYGCFHVMSRYRDLYEAEHRHDLFSSFPVTIPPFGNPLPMIPIEMDPPVHTKYRKIVGARFSLASVGALEEDIRRVVVELFDELRGRTEIDLVESLVLPVPMRVIGELFLEIREEDRATLFRHVLIQFTIPAGFDTTASTLSRTFLYLCEHPEARRRLAETPELLPTAIEEFLRYTTSVSSLARTVTQDCEFAGSRFRKGDRVALLWASGNRDEEVFPDPDEVVLDREPNRHLAFGSGQHRCLGSHLARAMVRIELEEFLRRMPEMSLVPDRPPVWHTGETWGLSSLPVTLERPLS